MFLRLTAFPHYVMMKIAKLSYSGVLTDTVFVHAEEDKSSLVSVRDLSR